MAYKTSTGMSDKNAKIMSKVHVRAYERNPPGQGTLSGMRGAGVVPAGAKKGRQRYEKLAAKGLTPTGRQMKGTNVGQRMFNAKLKNRMRNWDRGLGFTD